jgi:hypothetical protein
VAFGGKYCGVLIKRVWCFLETAWCFTSNSVLFLKNDAMFLGRGHTSAGGTPKGLMQGSFVTAGRTPKVFNSA